MTDFDAIVVGSGAGGLSAALRMAQQDVSVLVLEAMPSFGGYLNPFVRNGYRFDTGLHYLGKLGRGGTFRLLLELLGLDGRLDFVELDPDGFDRYVFPDFEVRLCKGKERYQERLQRLFPQESKAIERYFNVIDSLLRVFSDPHGPPKSLLDRLRYVFRHPVLIKYHRATYQQMLNGITRNPRLQAALSAHCGNSGLPPERASAFLCMMLLDHYLDGAYYPKGGSAALRDALVTALMQKNGVLKNRTPVTGIHRSGTEFIVTDRSGETVSARTVISNVDPLIAFQKLVDPGIIPRSIKKKVARLRPSAGSFYAFIGTRIDPAAAGLTDANIIHFEYTDVNRTFASIDGRQGSDPFPYYFVTSPSLKDPDHRHAPDGCHTLEIISGLGYEHPFTPWSGTRSRGRGGEYLRLKNQIGMSLVRSAERYIPGLSSELDYVEFATPLSNEYWVNSFGGGNFGLEQTPDQFGPGRFCDCTTGIQGLFVVGAGAICAGVLSCMASGVWAADKAVEFLG
ncbi:MAG: NAD(P)/FAD-dependent oxidoreductase [Deltaproteobacteria bacterium]|nr:NAD(P)/FAD-dependent oxidoreductase [Deltaproteobacteria bacterium]